MLSTMGQLGARWLRRCLALYEQFSGLPRSTTGTAKPRAYRFVRRSSKPRFRARYLVVTGWQLLVGWRDDFGRNTKPQYPSNQFTPRCHSCIPRLQTSVNQNQLQRWHVHSLRGRLPKRFCRLAVLVAGQTKLRVWLKKSGDSTQISTAFGSGRIWSIRQ